MRKNANRVLALLIGFLVVVTGCSEPRDNMVMEQHPLSSSVSTAPPSSSSVPEDNSTQVPAPVLISAEMSRGFLVSTGSGGDFPKTATIAEQSAELDDIISFAIDNHFNTIYFEVNSGGTAMYTSDTYPLSSAVADGLSPLEYLCGVARDNDIQVVAVLDTYVQPVGVTLPMYEQTSYLDPRADEVSDMLKTEISAIVSEHAVSGIMLDGVETAFADASVNPFVTELIGEVSQNIKTAQDIMLAVTFDTSETSKAVMTEILSPVMQSGHIDMVSPRIITSEEYYIDTLELWNSIDYGSAVLAVINSDNANNTSELETELLSNAMYSDAKSILGSYSSLATRSANEMEQIYSLTEFSADPSSLMEFSIPQNLKICYPASNISTWSTSIYIMGTSNPNLPLTLWGNTVPRIGTEGTFGINVPLSVGANTITIKQGDISHSVTVTRLSGGSTSTISQITSTSLFPLTDLGMDSNGTIDISCVGPAGASIYATVGGVTAQLSQVASAQTGVATTFKGSITLNSANFVANQVTNAGKVSYTVNYNGTTKYQNSAGNVYVAGADVPLMIEATSYVASVLNTHANDGDFSHSLKAGARVAVTDAFISPRGTSQTLVYQLSNGKYVKGDYVTVVTNAENCYSDITRAEKTVGDDYIQIDLYGGQPGVISSQNGDVVTLDFLDTGISTDVSSITGGILQSVVQTNTDNGFSLTLTCEAGSLWGYDVTHENDVTSIYLRKAPILSDTYGRPLEGIHVLLDPGHGGIDSGALGLPGITGPDEADVNLATCYAIMYRLEQMGATVTMTKYDDLNRVTLDDRNFISEEQRPHVFISIHHNSAALTKDHNTTQRMEVYYNQDIAEEMAISLMYHLSTDLDRNATTPDPSYYYVTRQTFAPAVLYEMGFMINPLEYELSCDTLTYTKAANAVGKALLEIF